MQVKVGECLSAPEWLSMVQHLAAPAMLLDAKRHTVLAIGEHKVIATASDLARLLVIFAHGALAAVRQRRVMLTAVVSNGRLCVSIPLYATGGDLNKAFFSLA